MFGEVFFRFFPFLKGGAEAAERDLPARQEEDEERGGPCCCCCCTLPAAVCSVLVQVEEEEEGARAMRRAARMASRPTARSQGGAWRPARSVVGPCVLAPVLRVYLNEYSY